MDVFGVLLFNNTPLLVVLSNTRRAYTLLTKYRWELWINYYYIILYKLFPIYLSIVLSFTKLFNWYISLCTHNLKRGKENYAGIYFLIIGVKRNEDNIYLKWSRFTFGRFILSKIPFRKMLNSNNKPRKCEREYMKR